jgi:hypothetical protein
MVNDRSDWGAFRPLGAGAGLYPAYLRYAEQARRALLELLPNDACRAYFRQALRPLSGEQFHACRDRLAAEGDWRALARLEETLAEGFVAQPTARERALCSPYLGLTGTS